MNLLRALLQPNSTAAVSITDWAKMFRPGQQVVYNGQQHQAFQLNGSGYPGGEFFQANSIVFACEAKRIKVFSEARFQFQRIRGGREGDLFGTSALGVLEEPWPGATTRDLLAVAELDVMSAGNSYWVPDGQYLLRLDPAKVRLLTERINDAVSGFQVGERLLGYAYAAGRDELTFYAPQDIAHYKPIPSPYNQFLGQSWLSACLPDVDADQLLTQHKQVSLRNGTKLDVVVSLKETVSEDAFGTFVQAFKDSHEGAANSGKTLFLGGGADVKTIGQTFENLSLKATQGAGETRIAACAGTPPVLVGLSEGLQGSSLNAGNYGAAKRSFVDSEMRPAWGAFCGAFQSVVSLPPPDKGATVRLWYDDEGIAFLREDVKDQADILFLEAQIVRQLVDAGFDADAAIAAVKAGDLAGLTGAHTGLFSVQLQKPGTPTAAPPTKGATQ